MQAITHSLAHLIVILSHPNLFSVSSIGLIELTLTWTWGLCVNSNRGNSKIDYWYNHQTFDAGLSSNNLFVWFCAKSHPRAQVEVLRPGPIDSDGCAGFLTEWLRLQDIYICMPGFKSQTSHQSIMSLTISSFNFTNWLDSVVKAVRYMHAPGSNPKQVLKCFAWPVIHGPCKIFYYLSLMSRTTFFYHQLDFTLWLRLQDICTPGFKSRTSQSLETVFYHFLLWLQ